MADRLKVACIQVTAGREVGPNIDIVSGLVRQARAAGAEFIAMPENVVMMEPQRELKFARAEDETRPYALRAFANLARETGAWLLVGSLAVKLPADPERLANRSYLIDPAGLIVSRYDKIHMFDVNLAGGESYRESAQFRPGDAAIVTETPWGKLGMSICYDLRFAALYRALAHAGATLISIPAAFTVPTGQAHWHTLVRARAIETGAFVLAPAQTGTHAEGRRTYGHSLIVDPWGEILAEAGEEVGFITAELDLSRIETARRMVPSLTHDRVWKPPA